MYRPFVRIFAVRLYGNRGHITCPVAKFRQSKVAVRSRYDLPQTSFPQRVGWVLSRSGNDAPFAAVSVGKIRQQLQRNAQIVALHGG